jgi:hypothetical protein
MTKDRVTCCLGLRGDFVSQGNVSPFLTNMKTRFLVLFPGLMMMGVEYQAVDLQVHPYVGTQG